jgi:hypothetical protein
MQPSGSFELGRSLPEPVQGELVFPATPEDRSQQWTAWQVRAISFWMDRAFVVPGLGWRFGLDPLIGLVPVLGDLASTIVSLYILAAATQLRVPRGTLLRMTLNVALDYVLGSLPIVGNVFDFVWKSNERNVRLLERTLAAGAADRRRQTAGDWLFVGGMALFLLLLFAGSLVLAAIAATWLVHRIEGLV